MSALGLALVMLSAPAAPSLVDGVAASIDRKVITLSEVRAEGRIALVNRGGTAGLERPLDKELLRSVLDYMIVQELLVQRARKNGVIVAEAEVDRGEAAFQARFQSEEQYRAFLADLGIDRDLVRAVIRRDAAVAELLRRRQEDAPAEVSEEAVDTFLKAREDFYPDAALAVRRQNAERLLRRQAARESLHELVSSLKEQTEVRVVAAFAAPAGEGEPEPAFREPPSP